MITRRSALAMLPAGLMAGSSFISLAIAQDGTPALKYDPGAARRIRDSLDPYAKTPIGQPHYEATKPIIDFYAQIANLFINPSNSKTKMNSKSELASAQIQLGKIFEPVDTILTMPKKTDEIIMSDGRRHILPSERTRYSTQIITNNANLKNIMDEQFAGSGDFDVAKMRQTKSGQAAFDKWLALTEDLFRASIELSKWGDDAFYAVARGYATYQFSRLCLRQGRSPLLLARAYTMKVLADSESYFALKSANLDATPATNPSPVTGGSQTPPAGITGSTRYGVEKEKFDNGRFPKEIYLGAELESADGACRRGQVKNYYGRFSSDSNFDNPHPAFRVEGDGVFATDCSTELNERGADTLNGWFARRLKDFPIKDGGTQSFKKRMNDITEAVNQHVRFTKNQKDKDGSSQPQPQPTQTQPPPSGQDAIREECKVMQQMTAALREVLAVT